MARDKKDVSAEDKQDVLTSGADGGSKVALEQGRVQQNEVVELNDKEGLEAQSEGIGNVAVMVNPARGSNAVEFPAVDEDGNVTVESFDAGKKHLVTSELAEAKDPQGVAYFEKLDN